MSRTALLILLLLLPACTGDDPVVGEPGAVTTPEAVATEPLDPLGPDETLLVTLEPCAEGLLVECDAAAATLSGDDVDVLIGLCTDGREEYCAILETVFGETDPLEDPPPGYAEALDALEDGEGRPDGLLVLNGAGIEVEDGLVAFGEDAEAAVQAITEMIGAPTSDTGYVATGDGSGCPGERYRFVTWAEMVVTILEESSYTVGAPHLAAWQTSGPTIAAQSFVGDATLVPIDVGLTTAGELREAIPADSLTVADEDPIGASFRIQDNLGELDGELSTTEDSGVVQSVASGSGCGE